MQFHGESLDEAMCFGLASGIQAAYFKGDSESPPRQIHGRGPNLETDFCENMELDWQYNVEADPDLAWKGVKRAVDSGLPPMIRTDLFHLDYYQTRTHFSGHVIVMVGYDDEQKIVYCSDNEFEDIQVTGYASLRKARVSQHPPQLLQNDWIEIRGGPGIPLEEAIRRALNKSAAYMLAVGSDLFGLDRLKAAASEVPAWRDLPDLAWTARFAYQLIERRGSGGASFRNLYAAFLNQAEAALPELSGSGLSDRMGEVAGLWTETAMVFKEISEGTDASGLDRAAELLTRIESGERSIFEEIKTRLKS